MITKILIIGCFFIVFNAWMWMLKKNMEKEIRKQIEQEFSDQIERERLLMVATRNQTLNEIEIGDPEDEQ